MGSEDDTWWVTWSPDEGEDVKYTHVRWSEMSSRELDVFQHGFSTSLKERLDNQGNTGEWLYADVAVAEADGGNEHQVDRGCYLRGSVGRD